MIHGESKSQATPSSLDHVGILSHFVNNRHSRVKTQGASCIGGFGQTDDQRKFDLGIPKRRGVSYIRGTSYIREKMVVHENRPLHDIGELRRCRPCSDHYEWKIGNCITISLPENSCEDAESPLIHSSYEDNNFPRYFSASLTYLFSYCQNFPIRSTRY